MAPNERNVLLLTGVGHFTTHFFELMFPTLAVAVARQQHVPLDEVLTWSFLAYLAFGLGALPAAFVGDRIGARGPLLVALFGLGVAALAASEVSSPRALIICLAVMGALASAYHPLGLSLIARATDAGGPALALHRVFGNAAIALTPIVTAGLCARFGWQDAYRLVGYAMCTLAVGCAFLPVTEPPPRPAPPIDRSTPIAWRPLAVLLLAATLAGISYRGNTLVQPGYFAEHVSEVWFGAAVSLAYLLGLGGQYVGRWLAERHDHRRLYLLFHACSLPPLVLMTLLGGLPLIASAAVFVFFSLGLQPIEHDLVARYAPPHRRAAIQSLKFTCTFGVGALAVWLVRWAGGLGGLSYAILGLAGVVLLVIAAAAVLLSMDDRPAAARVLRELAEVRAPGGPRPRRDTPAVP
jgi:MFS family permease